jgi:hypothetical protein
LLSEGHAGDKINEKCFLVNEGFYNDGYDGMKVMVDFF